MNLAPDVYHDQYTWNFLGVYSRNREEWAITDLACMRTSVTIVPFFDSLGANALEFVIN